MRGKPLESKVKGRRRINRGVSVPPTLDQIMRRHPTVNWSEIACQAFQAEIKRINTKQPTLEERVRILELDVQELKEANGL